MPPEHLFVYGTLRKGSDNKFARLLADQAQLVGLARVSGRLYDFGRYPGARPEDGSVVGEIFRFDKSSNLLATLDEYEGPEYERATVPAHLDDGSIIDCWIYWYIGAAAGRPIACGDWFNR